jgi:hypothetical protein
MTDASFTISQTKLPAPRFPVPQCEVLRQTAHFKLERQGDVYWLTDLASHHCGRIDDLGHERNEDYQFNRYNDKWFELAVQDLIDQPTAFDFNRDCLTYFGCERWEAKNIFPVDATAGVA